MNEVIGGRNPVYSLHLPRPRKPVNPALTHQDGDEALAEPNTHYQGEFPMYAPGTVGLLRGRVNLPDQSGGPLTAHLRWR